MMQVLWISCQSTYLRLKNGVKQRWSAIFPNLFNLYIKIILVTLKNSGLICHINGTYMAVLSYADDITLGCPCVQDLNIMMNICSDFATNNFITFNAKKISCIKYGESVKLTERILSWHTGGRHIGKFLIAVLI